jgi:peptidoglycan/xylan/chitin deacetylase (PgdA/CDA1 family)
VGLVLLVLLLAGATVAWPRSATVNGRRLRLKRGEAAAALLARAGIEAKAGDLRDVRGRVLTPGEGLPPSVYVDGRPASLDAKPHGGQHLVVVPGSDRCEALTEHVGPIKGVKGQSADIPSLRRTWVGAVTGAKLGSEDVPARELPRRSRQPGVKRQVALTFDDGPSPQWTPQVLRLLDRYRAKATFFVLGVCCEGPKGRDVLRQEIAAGHEIGNHSYNHEMMSREPLPFVTKSLGRTAQLLTQAAGVEARWFRPPYGAEDEAVRQVAGDLGYDVALWDVDPFDWKRPGADKIAERILSAYAPGDVILVHDGGGDRSQTLKALETVLQALTADGIECVTLSELRPMGAPRRQTLVALPTGPLVVQEARPGLKIVVNGQAAKPPSRPAEAGDDLLLSGAWILKLLQVPFSWDQDALAFTLDSPWGAACTRVSSRRLDLGGRTEALEVPPLIFRRHPLLPLWLVTVATGARVDYDEHTRVLRFESPSRPAPDPQWSLLLEGRTAQGRLGWGEPWTSAVPAYAARFGLSPSGRFFPPLMAGR